MEMGFIYFLMVVFGLALIPAAFFATWPVARFMMETGTRENRYLGILIALLCLFPIIAILRYLFGG